MQCTGVIKSKSNNMRTHPHLSGENKDADEALKLVVFLLLILGYVVLKT